jgi:hypothetical protein
MPKPSRPAVHPRRRTLLRWSLLPASGFVGWSGLAGAADTPNTLDRAEPPRLALLIGNRAYPGGEDLPPIHKNVRDLATALQKRGFTVTDGLDLELPAARGLVASFVASVKEAPADAIVFFYFSGHGAQVDSENLLVSSNVNPKARPDVLMKGSMTLTKDVIGQLPLRPAGLTIAVIDACRTSLKSNLDSDGLNQVEAPPGCLIAFATGAGKPAIAPNDDTRNTFYTASLVKVMGAASDEISFSDLFRLVKADTQQTMLSHPVALLRQFAQFPFIAENTQVRRRLAPRVANAPPPPPAKEEEAVAWQRLEAQLWPVDVLSTAEDYLKSYPDSPLLASAQVARDGAADAVAILRRSNVRLYRSAFQALADLPPERAADILKAGRGDKDAAARLGRHYKRTSDGSAAYRSGGDSRYEGWMQYAAALGNGIASYDLSLYYRRVEQPQLASEYETRARALGYTPPPSLDNSRK